MASDRTKANVAMYLILVISFAFGALAEVGFLESPLTFAAFVDSLISASESDAAVEALVDALVLEDMFGLVCVSGGLDVPRWI